MSGAGEDQVLHDAEQWIGRAFRHIKTQRHYTVIDVAKGRIPDMLAHVWVAGVVYKNDEGERFWREAGDFSRAFTPV